MDERAAEERVSAAHIVPTDMPIGWWHDYNVMERTPRDVSHDYVPYDDGDGG